MHPPARHRRAPGPRRLVLVDEHANEDLDRDVDIDRDIDIDIDIDNIDNDFEHVLVLGGFTDELVGVVLSGPGDDLNTDLAVDLASAPSDRGRRGLRASPAIDAGGFG